VQAADGWTILVYRSVGFVAMVLAWILLNHGRGAPRQFLRVGLPGVAVALCLGGAFIAFVLALIQANVATVVAILSVSPMAAGLLGWAYLGERPSAIAWIAMACAFLAVVAIVGDGLASGPVSGLVFACLACLGYAGAIVGLRAGMDKDMTPAVCLSGVVAGVVSLAAADTMVASPNDVAIGLLLGTVQIGAQYILLSIATRYASAGDVTLVMILEIVLAPIWVWVFVGESVPAMVLYGGAVIVAALVLNTFAAKPGRFRASRPRG
jgi:drug/metabolite transporter (DMT)-like permease